MSIFYRYLKEYFSAIPINRFLFTTLLITVLIFLNYKYRIENTIKEMPHWYLSLVLFFIFYLFVFGAAYLVQYFRAGQKNISEKIIFCRLIILAAFLFSLKMIHWQFPFVDSRQPWGKYWSITLQLPVKLFAIVITLFLVRKSYKYGNLFWGFTTKNFRAMPYLLILLCMVPLITFASTLPDFLHTYPKLKNIYFIDQFAQPTWPWKILYEISYGLDFVSIELFFRGFLVIGLIRFAGINSILPMAAFYCTIHFGKPLGECISSYFGGLALGVIAYRTKSVVGGLMVHLGIAYLMEIGGYIGNL